MQETVLITGGSGLIGTRLTQLLIKKGFGVRHISRNCIHNDNPCFAWDLKKGVWDLKAIQGVTSIIHLAGANVAEGRWTNKRKRQILESRIKGSELVCEMVEASSGAIKNVISASAVGYYGVNIIDILMKETALPGKDFLADVCVQWEQAISRCTAKVSIFRTGVVLSNIGGALPKMLAPIKWGLGSPLGNGSQWMPWIHIDDLCSMYLYALENKLEGIYNAVSPQPTTNKALTLQLAKASNRKILLPNVPSFVLKLMFGEMAQILLAGAKISAAKIESTGFKLKYPKLEQAVIHLLESN
jgi:uncharacterized protein